MTVQTKLLIGNQRCAPLGLVYSRHKLLTFSGLMSHDSNHEWCQTYFFLKACFVNINDQSVHISVTQKHITLIWYEVSQENLCYSQNTMPHNQSDHGKGISDLKALFSKYSVSIVPYKCMPVSHHGPLSKLGTKVITENEFQIWRLCFFNI